MMTSGRALSIAEMHARRRGDALGRVLDRERVGGGRRRDAPRVEHDAQQVHRFLEVGVAQVERPDDFFFVLAALGRRVGNDDDRLRRGDAEERARRAGDRVERVVERGVAQVDGDRRLAERRIEDQADVREPRDGREDVAAAGVAEDQRRRHLHVLRQVEAGRRQVARALDERLELGLALARDGDLRAQLVARRAQLLVDVAARRVQLGGELVFDERLVELADGREPAAARRSDPATRAAWRARALTRASIARGSAAAPWCTRRPRGRSPGAARRRGRGARRRRRRSSPTAARNRAGQPSDCACVADDQSREGVVTTSTPRGILNVNSLSAKPMFSFRFVKENVDVPPCASTVTRPRICERGGIERRGSANRSPVAASWAPASAPACPAGRPAGTSTSDGVKSRVRLPLPARNSAGVGRLVVGRHRRDDDLLVLRDVGIDLHAVRDEELASRAPCSPTASCPAS